MKTFLNFLLKIMKRIRLYWCEMWEIGNDSAIERVYLNFHLVSEWGLLLNANSAIFQLFHGENKLIFNEMMMRSALYSTNALSWIFIVLSHWNNSPRVDMSLHSDRLFWFRANRSLLFLLNAACLAEKQQISILKSLVWLDWGSNFHLVSENKI